MFDYIQFYHYIIENKGILKAAGSSEKYYWKRKQKISFHIMGEKYVMLFFFEYREYLFLLYFPSPFKKS